MSTKSETHLQQTLAAFCLIERSPPQQSENFRQQDQQVSHARYEKDKNFHFSI